MSDEAAHANTNKLKHVWIYEYKHAGRTLLTLVFDSLERVNRYVDEEMSVFDPPTTHKMGDYAVWYFENNISIYANKREIKY